MTRLRFAEEHGGGGTVRAYAVATREMARHTRDMVVERFYREAIFLAVEQGVSEIQQIIVARELLSDASRRGASS